VEGHSEGAVTDFEWLDTPQQLQPTISAKDSRVQMDSSSSRHRRGRASTPAISDIGTGSRIPGASHEVDSILYDNSERGVGDDAKKLVCIWQHVLSVGRDGRCLIQSFARGDRPISRVPPACFAMANLSPFQKGYGSLQIFSTFQNVPSGPENDFLFTGLRRDSVTANAPGVFRELPRDDRPGSVSKQYTLPSDWKALQRLPESTPELQFNIIDQGELDENDNPIEDAEAMLVAPEVVHLSRFANRYKLYPDEQCPTRASLCMHNAAIAESLRCASLAHMWTIVAYMIQDGDMDGLPDASQEQTVMHFVLLPTIRSLLEERANAGDVQTCVALCEILRVVTPEQTVRIPDLEIEIVREWYLSYIDLLRDMCLFSHATFLIRSCQDPLIGALNQQSTT
jgi:WD repeat-containing protein 24